MKTRLFTGRRGRTAAGDRATGTQQPTERPQVSIVALAADLFAAILSFRSASPEQRPPYRQFRDEIVDLLTDFQRRAERAGLDRDGDALLALVVLTDETAMSAEWAGRAAWMKDMLQVDFFKHATGGVEFFERAERLANGRDRDVIEIYYTCLCGGLRGDYRNNPDGLATIRARLYQRLGAPDLRDEQHLTPDAYGHQLQRPFVTRRFPLMLALPFIVGAIGLYAAYQYILSAQVAEIEAKAPAIGAAPAVPAAEGASP